MAVLVTGIGYIGAKLAGELLATGEEVVGVDNMFATDSTVIEEFNSNPGWRFVRGNYGSPRVLASAFRDRQISAVFCLAAQASAHPKAAPARYTEASNLLAPRMLLEAMRRHGVSNIVYASSLRVYGDAVSPDTGEDAPYGVQRDLSHLSKCYAEKLLAMYAALHGMRCIAARLGVVYGLSPVMKSDDRFITAPNKFCRQLANGDPVQLYGDAGAQTGFIHVADAVSALRQLARCDEWNGFVPVNVATEWTTVAGVAAIARDLAAGSRLASPTGFADAASAEAPHLENRDSAEGGLREGVAPTVIQIGRRLSSTDFQPRFNLSSGLAEVFDYFLERRQLNSVGTLDDRR